jgi:predicted GIY-YIG superfamily endonuclease
MFFKDRQEKFPEEFRIDSSDWDYQGILDLINQEPESDSSVDVGMFKDLILRIWRANNRAEQYASGKNEKRIVNMVNDNDDFDDMEREYIVKNVKNSSKSLKFIGRQSKAVLDLLTKNGFVIKDHTNSKYRDGMAVKVLVFETDEKLEESIITETIKPSIYYNDELISNGEVVVATPADENN